MGLTRRLARAAPGLTIALGVWCARSPWWTRRPRSLDTVAQALAPWAAVAGFPAGAVAIGQRRPRTAAAGLALGVGGIAMRRWIRGPATAEPGGRPRQLDDVLRIGHFNIWYDNQRPAAAGATLAALDLDVLVISELTPTLAAAFEAVGVTTRYGHRIDRARTRASGIAVWSRHPLIELPRDPLSHERIRARIDHPRGPVLLDALHTQSPIHHARMWTGDLAVLAAAAAPDEPAVMVGDFNAAWTHRRFRELAEQGWRDAHRTLGLGLRNSWRIDKRPLPPFVRLDHALVNAGVDVVAVDDIDLPGSDHRGFVVTVRRR